MDVETIFDDSVCPKRQYQKKTQLSVSQRKKFKDNIPVQLTPTVEFKSQRQLHLEKRNKNKEESSHLKLQSHHRSHANLFFQLLTRQLCRNPILLLMMLKPTTILMATHPILLRTMFKVVFTNLPTQIFLRKFYASVRKKV